MTVASSTDGGARRTELALAGLRVLLGLMFLTVWTSNLDKGLYGASQYAALIDFYAAEGSAPGFWKEIMRGVADASWLFSKLQLAGELVLGVLLVAGLLTRIAALGAWAFLTSLWISELGVPNEWTWSLVFPAAIAFVVAWSPAARAYSLDDWLGERVPLPRWAIG